MRQLRPDQYLILSAFTPDGRGLRYSLGFGGTHFEIGYGLFTIGDRALVTGILKSGDFPTVNASQSVYYGLYDALFVAVESPIWDAGICCREAGDADHDGALSIGDAVFLIGYIFLSGESPFCLEEGDADGDQSISIGDAVTLITHIFSSSPLSGCPVE